MQESNYYYVHVFYSRLKKYEGRSIVITSQRWDRCIKKLKKYFKSELANGKGFKFYLQSQDGEHIVLALMVRYYVLEA